MQTGETLRGGVRLRSGAVLTNIAVWAEYCRDAQPDAFRQASRTPIGMIQDTRVMTDAAGQFVMAWPPPQASAPRFIVRAVAAGFQPVYAGPWAISNPPADMIELVLDDLGAHLVGRCSDSAGAAITNVTAMRMVEIKDTPGFAGYAQMPVALHVEPDGSYTSEIVPAGEYSVTFYALGYDAQNMRCVLRDEQATVCDVVFQQLPTITGVVADAWTLRPIAGVQIGAQDRPPRDARWAAQGQFWVRNARWLTLTFTHTNYAPCFYEFKNAGTVATSIVVRMAGGADVAVHVVDPQGAAVSNINVHLCLSQNMRTAITPTVCAVAGDVIFSNVPCDGAVLRACAGLADRPLAWSEPFDMTARTPREILLRLPACGTLDVRLASTARYDNLEVQVSRMLRVANQLHAEANEDCARTANGWHKDNLPTGEYYISVHGPAILSFGTSVVVRAQETCMVTVPCQSAVQIEGTVRDLRGARLRGYVQARATAPPHRNAGAPLSDGAFCLVGLDPASSYDVTIALTSTNVLIKNVQPGGPPLAVVLPATYRITGSVRDAQGQPLTGEISAGFIDKDGEFSLTPFLPGSYTLVIRARGYVPVSRAVQVVNADVDLGEIVLTDRGLSIRGKVCDETGAPVADCHLYLGEQRTQGSAAPDPYRTQINQTINADGTFEFAGLLPARTYELWLARGGSRVQRMLADLQQDTDLGTIIVSNATASAAQTPRQ
ncbi:MAG: carboxypeptidase-like regulatory domain-containing protein [bacterium]|nr:carboxypeptidase-like regulatory domain-containing protein [bacterium]